MLVGTVREIKNHEYRVGLTPESVRELVSQDNEVWVETGAGAGIGAFDRDYEAAGATIRPQASDIRHLRKLRTCRKGQGAAG